MPGRPRPLGQDVHGQVSRQRGIALGLVGAIGGGVAVDHAARPVGDTGQRSLERETRGRVREGVAVTVPDTPADQTFNDVLLQQHRAETTGEVVKQCGETVVEIRMDQDVHRLRRCKRQCLDRLGSGGHVVVPVRQPIGEVLSQISDRRGPRGESRRCVVERRRRAHHEVPEVGRHRDVLGQPHERLRVLQDETRPTRHSGPPIGGIAHAPVEADAVPVDTVSRGREPVMDGAKRIARAPRIAVADLGVAHDHAGLCLPFLEGDLAVDAMMRQERRGADPMRPRGPPSLSHQVGAVGKLCFGEQRRPVRRQSWQGVSRHSAVSLTRQAVCLRVPAPVERAHCHGRTTGWLLRCRDRPQDLCAGSPGRNRHARASRPSAGSRRQFRKRPSAPSQAGQAPAPRAVVCQSRQTIEGSRCRGTFPPGAGHFCALHPDDVNSQGHDA